MTETDRFVSAATLDLTEEGEIYRWLRWVGFRGQLAGIASFTEYIELLRPALIRLATLYRNLSPAVAALLWAQHLRTRFYLPVPPSKPTAPGWFPIGALEDRIRSSSELTDDTLVAAPLMPVGNRALLLHAAAFVLYLIWRSHRSGLGSFRHTWPIISQLRHNALWAAIFPGARRDDSDANDESQSIGQFAQSFGGWVDSPPDPASMPNDVSLSSVTIDDSIDYIAAAIAKRREEYRSLSSGPTWKVVSPWQNLPRLLERTCWKLGELPVLAAKDSEGEGIQTKLPASQQVSNLRERATGRRWGDGASADRADRELLGDHCLALRNPEVRALRNLFWHARLQNLREPASHKDLVAACAGYVVGLSFATGVSPEHVPQLRVVRADMANGPANEREPSEGLLILDRGRDGTPRTHWLPPEQPLDGARFELLQAPEWPASAVDFRVHQLFPASLDELWPQIGACIAQALDCEPATANLKVKHALAQSTYSVNLDRATIRVVCGPGSTGVDASSLHHYIDASSPGIRNAYRAAQRHLFGLLGREGQLFETGRDEEACIVVSSERLRRVLDWQRQQIAVPNCTDPTQRHNRLATYLGTLFVATTGHREQEQILHFAWLVSLIDAIAFISDKQQVGSEARFVALPASFLVQFEYYLQHLCWLLKELDRVRDPRAALVRAACGLEAGATSRASGFLFRFRGNRLVPVSTDSIARSIQEAEKAMGVENPEPITARKLRRNLATFASAIGATGLAIERFLGHSGEQHPLGASGSARHLDRLAEFRVIVERYCAVIDAAAVLPPWVPARAPALKIPVPAFDLSREAYEGRKLEAAAARAIAIDAVRSEISLERLAERGAMELDDGDVAAIRERIRMQLSSEPAAREKVYEALAAELQALNRSGRVIVTAASINLARTSVGPVGVVFGRHYAIAAAIHDRLPRAICNYLSEPDTGDVKRLAVVAIALVAFEAVLNIVDLEAFIHRLQCDGPVSYMSNGAKDAETQLRLRCSVEGRSSIYERTCDLSDRGALAVLGYLLNHGRGEGDPISWHAVRAAAENLLAEIIGQPGYGLVQLIEVMKPHWLLRIPAFAFACSTGAIESTAESVRSTEDLLHISGPFRDAPKSGRASGMAASDRECAKQAIRDFLGSARGSREARTASSRRQRRELRRAFERGFDAELLRWMTERSIVDVWVQVLRAMLTDGGPKTDAYAFNSLTTYQSRVMGELVEEGWDVDIRSLSGRERGDFFRRVLERMKAEERAGATTVLRIVDTFLIENQSVEPCDLFPVYRRIKRRARNVLVSSASLARATKLVLARHRPRIHLDDATAGYLGLVSGLMLRSEEAYGLLHDDLVMVGDKVDAATIRPNSTRGIKSSRKTRWTPYVPVEKETVRATSRLCLRSRRKSWLPASEVPLFADPELPESLLPYRQISDSAILCLRQGSGNALAITYSLRHTGASRAIASLYLGEARAPIVRALCAGLGVISEGQITAFGSLRPTLAQYEWNVDRIAMWLGQEGVDTLLGSYCHVAWWVVSEAAYRSSQQSLWPDSITAAVLGLHRTAVVVRRRESGSSDHARQIHSICDYYTRRLRLEALIPGATDAADSEAAPLMEDLRLGLVDEVLALRADGLAGDAIAEIMESEHGVAAVSVHKFVDAYHKVLNATRFSDFEPDRIGRAARRGLVRRSSRRMAALARIERLTRDERFAEQTLRVAQRWLLAADANRPFMVSGSIHELHEDLAWIERLGHKPANFTVNLYRPSAEVGQDLRLRGYDVADVSRPLGRIRQIVPRSEYGVAPRIVGKNSDNRTFARILFVVACWAAAGRLEVA